MKRTTNRTPSSPTIAAGRAAGRRWTIALAAIALVAILAACASGGGAGKAAKRTASPGVVDPASLPQPVPVPPETSPETSESVEAGEAASEPRAVASGAAGDPPAAPPEKARPGTETLVVIDDPHADSAAPLTLREASRRALAQRETAPEPRVVITNENLAEYAAKGNVTQASSTPETASKPAPEAGETAAEAVAGEKGTGDPVEDVALAEAERDEDYWRTNARELRRLWAEAVEAIEPLEKRAAELRNQFYSVDDPHERDGRIKPAWDRVLDRLEQARLDVRTYRQELRVFLEEGRQAGALPGWLREGIELEPREAAAREAEPLTEDGTLEPGEPVIMDDPPGR